MKNNAGLVSCWIIEVPLENLGRFRQMLVHRGAGFGRFWYNIQFMQAS